MQLELGPNPHKERWIYAVHLVKKSEHGMQAVDNNGSQRGGCQDDGAGIESWDAIGANAGLLTPDHVIQRRFPFGRIVKAVPPGVR